MKDTILLADPRWAKQLTGVGVQAAKLRRVKEKMEMLSGLAMLYPNIFTQEWIDKCYEAAYDLDPERLLELHTELNKLGILQSYRRK